MMGFFFGRPEHKNNPYPATPQHGSSDSFVSSFHFQYKIFFFFYKKFTSQSKKNQELLFLLEKQIFSMISAKELLAISKQCLDQIYKIIRSIGNF